MTLVFVFLISDRKPTGTNEPSQSLLGPFCFFLVKNVLGFDIEITTKHTVVAFSNEPAHGKTSRMTCATSEDSDQPGHPLSLFRVFTVHMKKPWVLGYPLSAQQGLWSDWVNAQADLRRRWAHSHFCWFCHVTALYIFSVLVLPFYKFFQW